MLKPLIAVLSRNPQFTSDLVDGSADWAQLVLGESLFEMRELLERHRPGVVIVNLGGLSDRNDVQDFLRQVRERHANARLIAIGSEQGNLSHEDASEFVGLVTWLPQATSAADLIALIKEQFDQTENEKAQADDLSSGSDRKRSAWGEGEDSQDLGAEHVLSGISRRFETNSHELKVMLKDLEVAARHNVTILLIGETGSGKTFLSKLIHEVSPRRSEPFLHVACGALPNELIESELFGHVKGAFTSAHADKEGKFIAAGSGTILLDEIDVLGPEQQVKLLKVIETGEFEPVGSNRTLVSQARLVVASNLDLQPLVEGGRFRPDLYYRLNMLKFELLPLRSRKADIMSLAKKFIQQLAAKHQIPIARIENGFFEALYGYPWPGNVRELENVIQRAVIYSKEGVLGAAQLPRHILVGTAGPGNDPSVQFGSGQEDADTLGRQIAFTEKEIIEQSLFKNNFSRTHTAKDLGISRVTLYNKMKKYGMMKS